VSDPQQPRRNGAVPSKDGATVDFLLTAHHDRVADAFYKLAA
jgi:hypothetical protein